MPNFSFSSDIINIAEMCCSTATINRLHPNVSTFNITPQRAITLHEFKQMFYNNGKTFSFAHPPQNSKDPSNVLHSLWGKWSTPTHTTSADLEGQNDTLITSRPTVFYNKRKDDLYRDKVYVVGISGETGWINKNNLTPIIDSSRIVLNFNLLGGNDSIYYYIRDDGTPLSSQFRADIDIINSFHSDISKNLWTNFSKTLVEDNLLNLTFVSPGYRGSKINTTVASTWENIETLVLNTSSNPLYFLISIIILNENINIFPNIINIYYKIIRFI